MKRFFILGAFFINLQVNNLFCAPAPDGDKISVNNNKPYVQIILEQNHVLVEMDGKKFRAYDVFQILNIISPGVDLFLLSKEEALKYFHAGKKILILIQLLIKEANKQNKQTQALLEEMDAKFSADEIEKLNKEINKTWELEKYNFVVIHCANEKVFSVLKNQLSSYAKKLAKSKKNLTDQSYLSEAQIVQIYGTRVLETLRRLKPGEASISSFLINSIVYLIDKDKTELPQALGAYLPILKRRLTTEKFHNIMVAEIKSGAIKVYNPDGSQEKKEDFLKSHLNVEMKNLYPNIYKNFIL